MPDQTQTPPPPRLTLTLDMEKYLGQVEDWNLTEAQKREFIEAMWGLLVAFAELGFEINPVQLARAAGEQSRANAQHGAEMPVKTAPKMVSSKPYIRTEIIEEQQ